jgi:hypothetical protein
LREAQAGLLHKPATRRSRCQTHPDPPRPAHAVLSSRRRALDTTRADASVIRISRASHCLARQRRCPDRPVFERQIGTSMLRFLFRSLEVKLRAMNIADGITCTLQLADG